MYMLTVLHSRPTPHVCSSYIHARLGVKTHMKISCVVSAVQTVVGWTDVTSYKCMLVRKKENCCWCPVPISTVFTHSTRAGHESSPCCIRRLLECHTIYIGKIYENDHFSSFYTLHHLLKMEPTQSSETSAFNTQTPGKYPQDNLSWSFFVGQFRSYRFGTA
jgi:hypothetical protein